MRRRYLFIFLLLISLSGCNKCSDTDCIFSQPFIFKLSNEKGENLLDHKAVTISQLNIYHSGNRTNALRLRTVRQENETWIEVYVDSNPSPYTFEIEGVVSHTLRFDLMLYKTECCGTILEIKEAYLNETAIPESHGGWKNIIIP